MRYSHSTLMPFRYLSSAACDLLWPCSFFHEGATTASLHHPISQSVSQSVSHSVSQSVSQADPKKGF